MTLEGFSRFCCKTIRIIGIVLTGYLFLQGLFTICCIRRVSERTYYIQNDVFRQILGILLFLLSAALLEKKKVRELFQKYGNRLVLAALILMLGFLAFWVYHTRFWYWGDMEKLYWSAAQMLQGEYDGWQPGGYLYMWPHQNGLLLFVALLVKVFGMESPWSFLAFYVVNILFYGISILSMAYSLKLLFKEKEVYSIQSIMMICYLPYGFYCTLLYGNMIGFGWACASIAGLLGYLKKRKVSLLIGSAVCMILAIAFKQNELIIFTGLLIVLVFDLMKVTGQSRSTIMEKDTAGQKMPKNLAAGVETGKNPAMADTVWGRAVWILVYVFLVIAGIRIPNVIVEHITGIEVEAGNSKWAHLAMGIQDSDKAPGWYNSYNEDVFRENDYDTKKTAEASLASIRETWAQFGKEPASAWQFFHYKLASEWNNPTFECFHIQNFRQTNLELSSFVSSTINDGGKINILLICLFDILQSAVLFGVLMYLISAEDAEWEKLLFILLFIGAFLFFALWEAKCQYVIPFYFLLIPYAFPGYRALIRMGALKLEREELQGDEAPERRKEGKIRILGWNKMHTGIAVILLLMLVIALSDGKWVRDSFKMDKDTQEYYEYIHEYDHNFMNLRF